MEACAFIVSSAIVSMIWFCLQGYKVIWVVLVHTAASYYCMLCTATCFVLQLYTLYAVHCRMLCVVGTGQCSFIPRDIMIAMANNPHSLLPFDTA